MLETFAKAIFGNSNDREIKKLKSRISQINQIEPKFEIKSDQELSSMTDSFRERLSKGELLDDVLIEAFATVREASKRTLGQRHFDVQLMGGIVLHEGRISEMKTGEGKTLVATLPVYLNALQGKGVHVVTVNDYLATRDSSWMGEIYKFLKLDVGCIVSGIDDESRKKAYNCDVTYGTNNEFGFDYLRDNLKYELSEMVQKDHNFAIVDEVDSILIDEARTPLIISGPAETSPDLYKSVNRLIPLLKKEDYDIDEKARNVNLSESGLENIEQLLTNQGVMKEGSLFDFANVSLMHHVNQALRAYKLFEKNTHYMIKNSNVVIIDEFTGRAMEGRRYSDGLHQAIEAKENVTIQPENQTLASVTYQNYFRLYKKLSGMTGTALTEAGEFSEIYGLEVIELPTNKPIARNDFDDEVYRTSLERDTAVVNLIQDSQKRGQPILVGTVSIEKSESLSKTLNKNSIKHQVLNARYHEEEAKIIALAGVPGTVTIATNMAGRGTDIQLGGNLEMRLLNEIKDLTITKSETTKEKIINEVNSLKSKSIEQGGLLVIGTERHESRRIDNQLRGRTGRQGDPGASKFFLSLEDDLMRIFGSEKLDGMLKKLGLKEGEAITHPWINKAVEKAQSKVESHNFEIRRQLLKYDDVMNEQRQVIFSQRKEIMQSEDVSETIRDMRYDSIEQIISETIPEGSYSDKWDYKKLENDSKAILGIEIPAKKWVDEDGIIENQISERLKNESEHYMEKKEKLIGKDIMRLAEKSILLQVLDQQWKEHLLQLEQLRQGISLRAYAQKDPLNEYKREAFYMFDNMLNKMRKTVSMALTHVELRTSEENVNNSSKINKPDDNNGFIKGKIPRNAKCPCGSGKKYKHCHGKI